MKKPLALLERWVERYTRFAIAQRKWVLLLAALTFGAGALLASRLRVQGDFVELLPSSSVKAKSATP